MLRLVIKMIPNPVIIMELCCACGSCAEVLMVSAEV